MIDAPPRPTVCESPRKPTAAVPATWVLLASAGLALGYLLAPGHPHGWLPGLPWRPSALATALAIGIALFALWPSTERGTRAIVQRLAWVIPAVLLALTLAKLTTGALGLPHGLPAAYYDNSRFSGAVEPSTDFPGAPWTRLDSELDFGGDEFPTFFLNDVVRFNFTGAEAERRKNLPFAVRWQGTLYAPQAITYRFWLSASGPATLTVNGKQLAKVDADGRETAQSAAELTEGPNDVAATYARRPPRSGYLKVDWELEGRRQPLRSPYLFSAPVDSARWHADATVLLAARALDGVFLATLAIAAIWLVAERARLLVRGRGARWPLVERPLLGLWLAGMAAYALLPDLDRVGKFELLGGGQDWLTHEGFARDILINGPLMTLGKALGEGRTYYAQPFYPYALALFHWLTGEDLYGVYAIQVFGTGVTGVLLYSLAKRLFGVPAALATFALFVMLRAWHLDWVSRRLLSESVYFVILPALLLCVVRAMDGRRRLDFLLAGLFLGLAIVTRGPTMLLVPFVAYLLWRSLRTPVAPISPSDTQASAGGAARQTTHDAEPLSRRAAAGRIGLLVAVAAAIVMLVPIRNALVAGEPALAASSGGVNLQKLHRPSPQVKLGEAQRRPFAALIKDAPTRETVEFMIQDPAGYAASYVPLALYTLGYGAAIEESYVTIWPELVLLNVLYLMAILLLPAARTMRAGPLHAFVLVHFATMVVFAPYDYDNRLVLPMYLPIAVVAGAALAAPLAWAAIRLGNTRHGAVSLTAAAPRTERAT